MEIEAENVGVNVLKVFDGVEALKESLLELQGLGKCGRDGHDQKYCAGCCCCCCSLIDI